MCRGPQMSRLYCQHTSNSRGLHVPRHSWYVAGLPRCAIWSGCGGCRHLL